MWKISLLPLVFTLYFGHVAEGQSINHWETAVFNNDTWKYFIGTSEPDVNWRSLTFTDSGWTAGTGGFGFGDNDDNTIIAPCISVFIRIKFNVPDTSLIARALLSMDYDDAFVAYLNDVEIARAGITGVHPAFNQTGVDHEAKMYSGGAPETFYIDKTKLKNSLIQGDNVLAIQVHNSSITSSDLSSNAFLSFGILNAGTFFRPVPFWFTLLADLYSSNLPIVIINTDKGAAIKDNPRIMADMKIINRGDGLRNYLSDQNTAGYLNYNGRIDIEIRGSSSQGTPKKQYGFSTKNADGITYNNVSLLGLPPENDWILNGLVFDQSLIRNFISYNLSRTIGEYASRTVYCEVFLNDSYLGLYLLLEKIKPDAARVDIHKIDKVDNTLPKLSGGYITKADKITGGDIAVWTMSSSIGTGDVKFIHSWPKPEDATNAQTAYINSEFLKLSQSASNRDVSLTAGYPSVIDIPSFINYMIINELSANVDAYQFSTYFHKDRNGKLRAGPIWDLDLTYGNDLFQWGFDRSKTDKWQFGNGNNEGPKFWKNLYNENKFRCYLSKRWNELIKPDQSLNFFNLQSLIDQTSAYISEAAVRENAKWGTSKNRDQEIIKMKSWIRERILWMTNTLGSYSECSNIAVPPLVITKIMYAPDSTLRFPDSKNQEFIEIVNTGSDPVDLTGVYFSRPGFVYQFPVNSVVEAGGRKILASDKHIFFEKYGVHPSDQFTRNLSNTGATLILADAFGNVIDSLTYYAMPPWPDARENGYYLELSDVMSDNSKPDNWVAANKRILSFENNETDHILNLYPSPVKERLFLEFTVEKCTFQIIDFQGKILDTINVDSESFSLDMTQYKPGIYLIKVLANGRYFARKIIKM